MTLTYITYVFWYIKMGFSETSPESLYTMCSTVVFANQLSSKSVSEWGRQF